MGPAWSYRHPEERRRSRGHISQCLLARERPKKGALAELNPPDRVRAGGGSVKWWRPYLERERREEARTGTRDFAQFTFVTNDPQNAPRPKKNTVQKGKKENHGKGGRGEGWCCQSKTRHVPMQPLTGDILDFALSPSRLDYQHTVPALTEMKLTLAAAAEL